MPAEKRRRNTPKSALAPSMRRTRPRPSAAENRVEDEFQANVPPGQPLTSLSDCFLIKPLFRLKYLDNWPSIESTFIAEGRMLGEHLPHPGWQPLWYCGTRTDYIYPPALRLRNGSDFALGHVAAGARLSSLHRGLLRSGNRRRLLAGADRIGFPRAPHGCRPWRRPCCRLRFCCSPRSGTTALYWVPQRLHALMA